VNDIALMRKKAPETRGLFIGARNFEDYFLAFFAPLTACLVAASMLDWVASLNCLATFVTLS
jgi:hypothetical protein